MFEHYHLGEATICSDAVVVTLELFWEGWFDWVDLVNVSHLLLANADTQCCFRCDFGMITK